MNSIRVLHVVTHMNRGGLETMIMNYYRHIDREKVQFDFLVHRDERADYDDEIEALGGKIYRISRLVPWSKTYKNELNQFFKEHQEYKIVHVHQDCLSSVILKACKKNGVPVRIGHSHCASQDKNLKYPVKLYYKRFISKYATDLFACGKDAGNWMFNGAKYEILNNAIAAKQYIFNSEIREKMRRELGISNEFVVGLVARFSPQKNHHFLIDVFSQVLKIEPSAKLLLVSDGELRKEIEEKIKSLGIENSVIMTGVRDDVEALLQAMDVFVMPSIYEGLSLAIIEAQAAGLKCFISDKVSIECKKTELVEQIPLSETPLKWAEDILKAKGMERPDTYSEIVKSGFDITHNAKTLEEFYISKVKD